MPSDYQEPFSDEDRLIIDPEVGLKRGLKTRHVAMIALGGIIGPGLLIGSGGALYSGGPAALLIGFGLIGLLAFSVTQSVGELCTLYPTGGSFMRLGDRFVDKAFGMAIGWNYVLLWGSVLANEYNAISAIMTFWSDKVPIWGYFLLFWTAFTVFQLLGVNAFGEGEFWLALIKILGLVAFFLFSIVYVSGGVIGSSEVLGFRYWRDPGAFSNGFRGVVSCFTFCSTFYAGCEAIAIASTETKNPAKAIPRAVRQIPWRIICIYMLSAFFFGLTCPSNATGLVGGTSKVLKSPITIAIQNAGWEAGVHLVNAFLLVTCLSAINSSIYISSRTLLFLANDKKAPKFLGRTDKRGVPIPAIILANLFGVLSLMNISTGASKAYAYIVNLSGVSTFLVWGSISYTHIRFRQAWKLQGESVDDLPFKSFLYPYSAYFGLIANVFLALIQGWATFKPFSVGDFIDAYILLPVFAVLFFGYKFIFKTKWVNLAEVDLQEGRRKDLEVTNKERRETPKWTAVFKNL